MKPLTVNPSPQTMNAPYVSTHRALSRRQFLRGTGVALALPLLEAMLPSFVRASSRPSEPRRILAICNNLGLLPEKFFPEPQQTGRGYTLSPYLALLSQHREDFTVFSGVWHPDVDGGHPADNCFLTAAPHPGSGGFRNTISLDQYAAEQIGHLTRFPALTLGVNIKQGERSLSWTGNGVLIPCEEKPSEVFKRLFLQGTPAQVTAQIRRLELGESIMDAVAAQTRGLQRDLSHRDRERLDQYLTGVRDLEKRMASAREWENRPKPATNAKPPLDPADPREYMEKTRLMYEMARLAFETDSTRLVTLLLDSVNSPAIDLDETEIKDGYHSLSHHGKNQAKLDQLEAIDRGHMRLLDNLFTELKARTEDSASLFDRTMILYGSNLGNANTHVTTNLPVLFAGGGFRHGQHLAFDRERNYPLPNLFVSMLQRLGLPVDRFASSTGTMRGLEMA
jgi:hypothetical protein